VVAVLGIDIKELRKMLRKVPETISFKHKFSLPLYKLILRHQFKKYNYTARITLEDLRELFLLSENEMPL